MKSRFLLFSAICFVSGLILSCNKDDASKGKTASVTTLGCNTASFSATATAGTAYTATATVPYTGGNGASYTAGTGIASTDVTGLTARLNAGTLTSSTGNISYQITGTPSAAGTASFAISFGGKSCTLSLTVTQGGGLQVPAIYTRIYGATSITYDGTWVYIKTNDQPDHKSVYWPISNPLYENFSGPTYNNMTFTKNPNSILIQNATVKIPANPNVSATHPATPLGVIGIALDGVPFFNQYAGPNQPLTNEIGSFDQAWAHPQQTGVYHYHVEPKYLTQQKFTPSSLVGFLLDGYPVYGPQEADGSTASGLDVYHGHSHVTADYPSGTYHYHFSQGAPYLNGSGFYGDPGTVTQ
jgi:hypothetical protein